MHALEGFSQLVYRNYSIEAVKIYDSPRFAFRGAQTSSLAEVDCNDSVEDETFFSKKKRVSNVCMCVITLVIWCGRIYD